LHTKQKTIDSEQSIYVEAAKVILAPDCGMKYLPRGVALAKLQAMVEAARRLRAEYGN
jgi:5-methyltetrahydropteroyltriglutamate--homocysteine methyltransferase